MCQTTAKGSQEMFGNKLMIYKGEFTEEYYIK